MRSKDPIRNFDISPQAKSGLLVKKLEDQDAKPDHDNFNPHRDNHYLLMLATAGEFRLNLDFNELNFNSPALFIISPGQVHYIINTLRPKGWGISFDPGLVARECHQAFENNTECLITLDIRTIFYQRVVALADIIEKMQSDAPTAFAGRALHSLLDALLNLITGELIVRLKGTNVNESRIITIEQDFRTLLKKNFKEWKQPSRYALELNISVKYLYDAVKEVTGQAVSVIIQQYAVLEAKRLLFFTDLSAKEIGYELGYQEPVSFGKLFKKLTGFTPMQFRRNYRN